MEFNSLSKTYGLAGARCGFCVGCRAVVERLSVLKSNLDYGMFLPIQKAAIAAITGDQSCVEATRQAYQQRRDVLVEGLNALGWPVQKPQATMFVWAKLPHGFADDRKFVQDRNPRQRVRRFGQRACAHGACAGKRRCAGRAGNAAPKRLSFLRRRPVTHCPLRCKKGRRIPPSFSYCLCRPSSSGPPCGAAFLLCIGRLFPSPSACS